MCPGCQATIYVTPISKFCPNCGAKIIDLNDSNASERKEEGEEEEESKELTDILNELQNEPTLMLVKDLNKMMPEHNWQIRCILNKKHPIKHHPKGKLFKIDLLDEQDGRTMIEGTFYTEETDHFYDKIIEGKTYLISKVEISAANKKFTTIRHDFRIIFKLESEIKEVSLESKKRL